MNFSVAIRLAGHNRPTPAAVFVAPFGTAGYPVVRAFLDSSEAGRGPFLAGDRVIRVGATDLATDQLRNRRRAGRLVARPPRGGVEIERDSHRVTVSAQRPAQQPVSYYADLLLSACDAAAAILILTRAKAGRSVVALFYACATWSLLHVAKFDAPG